ncbi:MAG: hypothetical protein R3F20_19135 [Planctomycetota bacterium]
MSGRDEMRRRHLPTLATIVVAVSALWLVSSRAPLRTFDEAPSLLLVLRAARALAASLPDAGPLAGPRVLTLVFSLLAGAGLFFFAWRLHRNRAVAWSSGLLVATQPALIALADAGGVEEAILLALGAWALALQARPDPAAPRFANRPPSRMRPRVLGLLLLGAFAAREAFLLAPLILFADLFIHPAERGRRDWRGAAPYLAAGLLAWILAALGRGEDAVGPAAPGAAVLASLLTLREAGPALGLALFGGVAALAAGLAFADLGLGIGRRRVLVRQGALALGWIALGAALGALAPGRGPAAAGPLLGIGAALFAPVLIWRLLAAVLPPLAEESEPAPRPALPAWPEIRAALELAALPSLEVAEPPRPAAPPPPPAPPLERLLARIEDPGLGLEEGLPLAEFRRVVRPLVPEGGRLLELEPRGRFSPYAGPLAALGGETHLVVPTRGDRGPAADEFAGLAGVEIHAVGSEGDWSLAGLRADLVLFAFGLGSRDPVVARRVLGRLAEAAAAGGRVVGYLAPATRAATGLDEAGVRAAGAEHGLELESTPAPGLLVFRRTDA